MSLNSIFTAPIDLRTHTALIYADGVFSLKARKKHPMRAKTADGILRYAPYRVAGIVDSVADEQKAGDVLPTYLAGEKNFSVPIFSDLQRAKEATGGDVLILGAAPEGGDLPYDWESDIEWAIKRRMHIVSGMHYALAENLKFQKSAKKYGVTIWDVRKLADTSNIPVGSACAYHIKKPIVLTVGTDAAIGKMTVGYEMARAAKKLGRKSCVIPTGQTAIMIEGWGVAIDALPADFMAGAVEKMLFDMEKKADIFFVEGQGSLFHPAYSNTCISLIHGAVPTHLILVHRPQRKHSIGSPLIKLPGIKTAIHAYEAAVLPPYRNTKVVGVALNTDGIGDRDAEKWKKKIGNECGLPVFDALRDTRIVHEVVRDIR